MEKKEKTRLTRTDTALLVSLGFIYLGLGTLAFAVGFFLRQPEAGWVITCLEVGRAFAVVGLVGIVVVNVWVLFGAIAVKEWHILSGLLAPWARDLRPDWRKNIKAWGIGFLLSSGAILVLLTFVYLSGVFIGKGQFLWMCATVVLTGMLTMRDVVIRTWPPRSPRWPAKNLINTTQVSAALLLVVQAVSVTMFSMLFFEPGDSVVILNMFIAIFSGLGAAMLFLLRRL